MTHHGEPYLSHSSSLHRECRGIHYVYEQKSVAETGAADLVKLISYLHLVLSLRTRGAIPPFPLLLHGEVLTVIKHQ